ncbi:peptide deformylase [Williamsia phyllosphaerae]|uniref:Peptide deformylase n=1 Tax=Williamsia phyllosphaerae TaxID=885042 RepID=A0ABQ1V861_9NOCA|nr:peptide deformylase [Williamsia phyllosphaerae]GGF41635.1 peptide deformylase 1 [Williamsia phyllosphaerae]
MSVVPIRLFGDPVLRTRAAEVTDFGPELGRLIDDMFETMDRHNGAGLAATQIGVESRVFVFNCGGMRGHIVNPVFTVEGDDTQTGPEGCLSIPGIQASCTRAAVVTVSGVNRDGVPLHFTAEDIVARAIQHETDHLDGVLFLQRLEPTIRKGAMRAVRESEWFAAGVTSSDDPGAYPTTWVHEPDEAGMTPSRVAE